MKRYCILAAFGFACLAAAAVWMGGLNQDEGWYLYAANLVAEGKMPYRDFFYTQGPMLPIVYSAFAWIWKSFGILGARVFTLAIGLFGILLAAALARRLAPEGRRGEAAIATLLLLGSNLYRKLCCKYTNNDPHSVQKTENSDEKSHFYCFFLIYLLQILQILSITIAFSSTSVLGIFFLPSFIFVIEPYSNLLHALCLN